MVYLTDGNDLTAIANAIRQKTGGSAALTLSAMPSAIASIEVNWPGLLTPIEYDWNVGYVTSGTWTYEDPTDTYCDIYEVVSGHTYNVMLGNTVGTRFRIMTTTTDIREVTSGKVTGTNVISQSDPVPLYSKSFTSDIDGYLIVSKDNVGQTGIMTYVIDKTGLA